MAQESIHEEIQWLEEQLEAKKREAADAGVERHEKEIIREVIKDASQEKTPAMPSRGAISDDAAQQTAYQLKEKEHAHIIEELVALAFAKGIDSAMKVARAMKNPHILDEFHDMLADKYYEKLLAARKIK